MRTSLLSAATGTTFARSTARRVLPAVCPLSARRGSHPDAIAATARERVELAVALAMHGHGGCSSRGRGLALPGRAAALSPPSSPAQASARSPHRRRPRLRPSLLLCASAAADGGAACGPALRPPTPRDTQHSREASRAQSGRWSGAVGAQEPTIAAAAPRAAGAAGEGVAHVIDGVGAAEIVQSPAAAQDPKWLIGFSSDTRLLCLRKVPGTHRENRKLKWGRPDRFG